MIELLRGDVCHIPLADHTVDLIFTDPPYDKGSVPLYGALAHEACRVLKAGAFVLVMAGGAYLDRIFAEFAGTDLEFYWKYELEMIGWATGVYWPRGNRKINITTRVKPILAFSLGASIARTCTLGLYRSGGPDKRYHHWGQDVASARYFVDCFSALGDLVVDPFVGGGTTAVACRLLSRRFIGMDLAANVLTIARHRLQTSDAVVQGTLI